MNKYAKHIRATLDNRTLLEQLAEECSELSKASLKLIRAMGRNNNVTPVSPGQAMDNFREEVMDVLSVIAMIEGEDVINGMVDDIPYNPKLKRWAERLGYEESYFTEINSDYNLCKDCDYNESANEEYCSKMICGKHSKIVDVRDEACEDFEERDEQ